MLKFVQTCGACPEQYDVYGEDGEKIAYVRLRHGYFAVYCPDFDGELVLDNNFDHGLGIFDSETERRTWLSKASTTIIEWRDQNVIEDTCGVVWEYE